MAGVNDDHAQIVREADIDLILCEELAVSPQFLSWFVAQTFNRSGVVCQLVSAFTHVLDRFGECDIFACLEIEGKKTSILIENKIDVDFQPNQAERYLERGKNGVETKLWDSFVIVLVAPENYSRLHPDAMKFHAVVSYEQIQSWFLKHSDVRSSWRARMFNIGIEQNRKGYVKQPDPKVTLLWKSYWTYRAEHFPQIAMPEPGPQGHRNGWPKLGGLFDRDGIKLLHKLPSGCVDLVVMSTTEAELVRRLNGIELPYDSAIIVTGKSTSIRITVPVVDYRGEFEPQVSAVHAGLEAADRLLKFLNEVGNNRLTGR